MENKYLIGAYALGATPTPQEKTRHRQIVFLAGSFIGFAAGAIGGALLWKRHPWLGGVLGALVGPPAGAGVAMLISRGG